MSVSFKAMHKSKQLTSFLDEEEESEKEEE